MFESRLLENVKEGEEVLAIIRRSPTAILGRLLAVTVLIIAPFFFSYPLLRLGPWGAAVIFASLLFGIGFGLRTLWVHQLNAFILTAERIIDIDQRGFFHRVVSEATLDKVQDVSYVVKGVWATIFQYGAVVVQTAGGSADLELAGVRRPRHVQELILRLQREMGGTKEQNLSADELLAMVQKIKEGVGEEQFRRLVARKPPRQV